jgi:5-oxoprolinase (ATP-hydrolysing) subunit C
MTPSSATFLASAVVLQVEEVGPATSVQDAGRFGGQRFGLGTAGAMDRAALAIAQALVGASPTMAAIEVGPFATKFKAVGGTVRVALAGCERALKVGDRAIELDTTVSLADGDTLSLGYAKGGVFTYLAIEGGILAAPVMGSLSVHMRAGLGSPFPRPLKVGDRLAVRAATDTSERRIMRSSLVARADVAPIRCVLGPQVDYFSADMIAQFLATPWRVSATSDRMGYRLEGAPLTHAKGFNIVSDGIANGSIQIPGNGLPLVLLADRGTTGGYPKIATIISADLGRVAQTGVGQTIQLQAISIESAQAIARAFAAEIAALPGLVQDVRNVSIAEARLFDANVAGAAVNAIDWMPD